MFAQRLLMERIKHQDGRPQGIPFIFVSHIREQEISLDTQKFVDEEEYDNLTKHTPIEIGDVLYTCVGSYGNAAVVTRDDRFIFQRHIAQIKPDTTRTNPIFIAFCLETQELKRQADKVATGIAQKTVTLKGIKSFSVPVPRYKSNVSLPIASLL